MVLEWPPSTKLHAKGDEGEAMPAMVDLRLSYSEEQRERFRNRVLSHEWREPSSGSPPYGCSN